MRIASEAVAVAFLMAVALAGFAGREYVGGASTRLPGFEVRPGSRYGFQDVQIRRARSNSL